MTLYETIFRRRSVRKFLLEALDSEVLNKVADRLSKVPQLEGQNARFKIVSGSEISNNKAPHFILAFCENNVAAYANVGFCLQEMDLFIQSLGLGSLWLGTAKPNGEMDSDDYCIMLAFGKTEVPLRDNSSQFDRLEMAKISNVDDEISKAARLAPSAVNSQPWKLIFGENFVEVKYFGRGMLKLLLKNKFSKIDMGIITKHLVLALQNGEKTIIKISTKNTKSDFSIFIEHS